MMVSSKERTAKLEGVMEQMLEHQRTVERTLHRLASGKIGTPDWRDLSGEFRLALGILLVFFAVVFAMLGIVLSKP